MTRRSSGEEGSILILTAILVVAMLLMVAIVVDLGSTRAVRGKARAAADSAATAGALDLGNGTNAATACAKAFGYAFSNLGGNQPTAAQITQACTSATNGGMGACTTTTVAARVATLSNGNRTLQVTNPVPDDNPLMLKATTVGGGVSQANNVAADGSVTCGRIGVEITEPQSSFFGGVASSKAGSFSIHSVARYRPVNRGSLVPPALVVLNQRACKAINTGNGNIWVDSTLLGPGLAYSDSDGTNPPCGGSEGILHTGASGSLRAAGASSMPGELAWYLPCSPPAACPTPAPGFTPGRTATETGPVNPSTFSYVGKLYGRPERTTRGPADAKYHCTKTPVTAETPLCTNADPAADPVKDADALAQATTAPSGFSSSTQCGTTGGPVTLSGKVFLDCPEFLVKANPLIIAGGATIIFKGRLTIDAGGTLAVNVSNPSNPVVDAGGLPVPAAPEGQSRLIVGSTAANAVDISTNSASVYLAQTSLYSRGGFKMQSLNKLLWSPPSSGPTKGLMYWSDAAQPFAIQGGPAIKAAGVLFHGNGTLASGGNGIVDLRDVQVWVDKIDISGGATVRLKPDPANSITVTATGAGSSLIR